MVVTLRAGQSIAEFEEKWGICAKQLMCCYDCDYRNSCDTACHSVEIKIDDKKEV